MFATIAAVIKNLPFLLTCIWLTGLWLNSEYDANLFTLIDHALNQWVVTSRHMSRRQALLRIHRQRILKFLVN